MTVFFVVFAVLAVLGMAMFSANVLMCILLLAGALAGAAASCFEGRRGRLYQAILLALCLVLCCCSGRGGNTQIATYEQRLEQIGKQIARGNLDKAKSNLEALEKLCAPSDKSRYLWTKLYFEMDDPQTAYNYLCRIEDQQSAQWYTFMILCCQEPGMEDHRAYAAQLSMEAADALPDHAQMQQLAGSVQLDAGSYVSALYYLQRAATLDPSNGLTMYFTGNTYLALGDSQKAAAAYKQALALGVSEDVEESITANLKGLEENAA